MKYFWRLNLKFISKQVDRLPKLMALFLFGAPLLLLLFFNNIIWEPNMVCTEPDEALFYIWS